MEYLEWYYLLFELPFIGALLYLFLMMFSGIHVGHDGDLDADHDIAVSHDIDHGIEHTVGDHEHHFGSEAHHESSLMSHALSLLGVGKVPLSLLVMILAFLWGGTGWLSNVLLQRVISVPEIFFVLSVIIAFACSVFGTSYFAKSFSRVFPSVETYSSKTHELIGKTAAVRFAISSSSGTVQLYDRFNNFLEVPCRVCDNITLLPGTRVLIVDYDKEERKYIVAKDVIGDLEKELKQQS